MIDITPAALVENRWMPRSISQALAYPSAEDADYFSKYIRRHSVNIEVSLSDHGKSWSLSFSWWPRKHSQWPIGLTKMEQLEAVLALLRQEEEACPTQLS